MPILSIFISGEQYQEQLLDYQRQLEQQRNHSLQQQHQQQQQYTLPMQSQQQCHPPGGGGAIGQVLAHAIVSSPERQDHVNWDPSLPVVHQLPPATNAIQGQLNTLLQEKIQSVTCSPTTSLAPFEFLARVSASRREKYCFTTC